MKEKRFAKLHPAISFGFFVLAICLNVLIQHPAYLASSLFCALCLNISLSGKKAIRNFLALIPFWAILSAVNPLFNVLGTHVLFTYFGRPYTFEALCYGMVVAGMFVAMLQWFSAYNAVMTEDKFFYLFNGLAPSLALLLTTVLRMIPSLKRKAGQITSARRCIGMGTAEGTTSMENIRNGMASLSVLTTWALEGSVITADSMNGRGYGTGKRSCFCTYQFTVVDAVIAAASAVLCAIAIASLAAGSGTAAYTPSIFIAPVRGKYLAGLAAHLLFLLMPTLLNLKEEIQWHILKSRI